MVARLAPIPHPLSSRMHEPLPPTVSSRMRGPIPPSSAGAHLVGAFPLPCPRGCGAHRLLPRGPRPSSAGAYLVGAFPLPCPRGCDDPSRLLPQGRTLWAPSPSRVLADARTHPAFFRRGVPCGRLPPPVSSRMRGPIRPSSAGAHLVGVFPLPCPRGCGDPSPYSPVSPLIEQVRQPVELHIQLVGLPLKSPQTRRRNSPTL